MQKQKKTDIKYDIRLFDNRQFSLKFTMQAPADIITKLAKWMAKKQGETANMSIAEFAVDERLNPKILKGFRKSIEQVEKKVKKDIAGFSFVTFHIDECTYKKAAEKKFNVKIRISGDFVINDPLA